MKNYDDYIVFLLGSDNFKVCQKIRELAELNGMDTLYDDCIEIAKKFNIYDMLSPRIAQYDNFADFINKYENEILDYIIKGNNFEVFKGVE